MQEILNNVISGAFKNVLETNDPGIAASHFSGVFGTILNKHAPLKTFQVRNNYSPWISKKTHDKIAQREKLKLEAANESDLLKLQEYKTLRNQIQEDLEKDEENYYKEKFYSKEISVGNI